MLGNGAQSRTTAQHSFEGQNQAEHGGLAEPRGQTWCSERPRGLGLWAEPWTEDGDAEEAPQKSSWGQQLETPASHCTVQSEIPGGQAT